MNFSTFAATVFIILSVIAAFAFAAPNATVHNAAVNKRPAAAQVKSSPVPSSSGPGGKSGISTSASGSTSAKGSGTRSANGTSPLSRVRRGQLTQISHFAGTGATNGVNQQKEPTPSRASGQTPAVIGSRPVGQGQGQGQGSGPVPPQSGNFGRFRRSSASTGPQVSLKYGEGGLNKANATRNARSSTHGESSQEEHEAKSSDEESTHSPPKEVPVHPLLAHRQANNLTESLRPKLRSPAKGSQQGSQGESETEGEGAEGHVSLSSPHQVKGQAQGAEEEEGFITSVISPGPVLVQGRNATFPGFASGTRKQQVNRDDEE